MANGSGRGIALAVLLGVVAVPNVGYAQKRRQPGPVLPHPVVQSVFPCGVTAGGTVDVSVRGTDLEGATSLWFDHPGLRALPLKTAMTFRVVCASGTPVGQHDVRAVGSFGVSNARKFVVGDRPESIEVEPNNVPAQASKVAINTVVNGEIGTTDVDCFAFEGKAGQRLLFDLQAERIDSRLDATLRLFDPLGREVAESRDAVGVDPFLDVKLSVDGRHVLKVHDVVYRGSPDYHYRLTLTDGPHIDAVVPNLAHAGESARVTLIGRNLGGEAAPDLSVDGLPLERKVVTIAVPATLDPDTSHPARDFVPSTGAARRGFEYTLGTSNPVFIAEANDPIVVEREPNDRAESAQAVDLPCDISGTFATPGDMDIYRFRARKGEVYWVEADAERIGSQADPVFVVQKVNPTGDPADLAVGDDMTERGDPARFFTKTVDAAIRWQVPEDGLYQVSIADMYGSQRGDPRLSYRLNIRPERPDFQLFVLPDEPNQPDALNLPAGGRALASVLAVRSDGFNGPIRVEAVDLPAGVRCEPTVIAGGQTTGSVVFEADRQARPTLGTVRLVGRARFGDRKNDLGYTIGVNTLGPDVTHEAVGGGIIWPLVVPAQLQGAPPTPAARLTRGFVVQVIDPEPLTLTARAGSTTVTPGGMLALDLTVTRGAGFTEAVAVSLAHSFIPVPIPINAAQAAAAPAGQTVTIAKTETAGVFPLTVPKTVTPGVYTLVFQATGPYPFSKDPNAKARPNVSLIEPSNPITVVVRPAPATVAVNAKGGSLKAGGTLEIEVTVTPTASTAATEPLTVSLTAPPALKLSADAVQATPGKPAKLVVKAAPDSPIGVAAGLAVRATLVVNGGPIDVNEPVAITVTK